MAGVNKNSRRGTINASKNNGATANIRLLIPTGGGRFAYVFNPADGTNVNLAVDSEAFFARLGVLAEGGLGERLVEELESLVAAYPNASWDTVLGKFAETQAMVEAAV